jgi:hypothetical protein
MTQPQVTQNPTRIAPAVRAQSIQDNAERISEAAAKLYDDRFNLQGIVKLSEIYAWAEHLETAARSMKNLARYVEHLEGSEGWE